ncbi:MAG: hypothetical protein ACOC15_02185 [Desulfovibrionales bacterium]
MLKIASAAVVSLLLLMAAPVLSAQERKLTVLYSGDARGYVLPCDT